ncbi:MAG: hypothetical protein E6I76_12500 [Chloroflexi bacterium]|nr:MAG: hypothetical protein E6I76_12500 [Chloroflexota bacterium]
MRRMSAFAAAVIVGAACATVGAARPGAARAEGQGFQGCYGFGRVAMAPGVTMSPQDGTVHFTQNLGPCRLSDPGILSGTLTGTGQGRFSCAAGQGTARFLARWENGRTSAGTFSFGTLGSHLAGHGTVTEGEFAGDHFGIGGELDPSHPSACASGGVTEATSYESIGVSPG